MIRSGAFFVFFVRQCIFSGIIRMQKRKIRNDMGNKGPPAGFKPGILQLETV